ncbi:ATP-dependent DNA helicase RecG [Haliea sp. E1-2-M8]|uniref:ATP-dependent DNA helicase RecG n=1 Tax=Haliea sp. E1-2-M8 TaxID=3064706 RepID=UPI00271FD7D9|nr:ATP-dependent DNA helicase RecG [Haliea sp. E1-2-M8]MDO8860161.1 ATP-dependent DNA helicase RecG [Haliea sp. E1-2-M8]
MAVLETLPVTALRGVGPRLAQQLADYGVTQVEDLLFHLPLRYQDRTRVTPIAALQEGGEVSVEGEVRLADIVFGRRRSLVARIQDGTGTLTLRFFHFTAAQKHSLQPGARVRCFGQVRRGASGYEIFHPEYRVVTGDQEGGGIARGQGEWPRSGQRKWPGPAGSHIEGIARGASSHKEGIHKQGEETLTPVYPTTNGIGQAQWRKLCAQALQRLEQAQPRDLLPAGSGLRFTLVEALRYLHAPPPDAPLNQLLTGTHPAQLRLALEELVAHNLSLLRLREKQQERAAPALQSRRAGPLQQALLTGLPFDPTAAQLRVMQEIGRDLARPLPMLRLVQGDVGSGKTLVAAHAALQAIANGYQVALMAPTEILAEQHRLNFAGWFEPLGIGLEWLSGRVKGRARKAATDRIASGEAAMVIGTHALFQEDVGFHRLGLVMVDEQHKFGVHQRLALSEKAGIDGRPHQLVLTATPIPRTLSMVAYADLDCSVIDELPPGRQPVTTLLVDSQRREQVIARVASACSEGRQAYWVCTLIEESDALQAQAAEATAELLQEALPELTIGLVHGRMKPADKAAVMAAFKAGTVALLVATTVIEVGVDVPNASLMIIENPERLGLAQLHQLRGRVGRGGGASHCVLLYQSPLSRGGKQRLVAMRESNDGFYIAERDLELRGPGEVLGTRQTGLMAFRIAELPTHNHLLDQVQAIAGNLQREDPAVVDELIQRWTGSKARFAEV